MSEKSDWLKLLSAGDEVIVVSGLVHTKERIAVVERRTPAYVVVDKVKYRVKDGHSVGGGPYYQEYLSQPNPERKMAIRMAKLRRRLSGVDWSQVPDDIVLAVIGMVP